MSRSLLTLCVAAALILGSTAPSVSQQGHAIDKLRHRVIVDTGEQWEAWTFPHGTVEVTADGVRPRLWHRGTEATREILAHLRTNPPAALAGKTPVEITLHDAVRGTSNEAGVIDVLDGDMTTYWEPDRPDGAAELALQWRFTVDLGRVVLADRIVLRFVDEELGDPFLLFDVFVSDGQRPVANLQGDDIEFTRVFQTLRPTRNQRVFEIDVSGLGTANPRKRLVRFVQVVVTGSDGARGREVSASEYERLRAAAPADTGLVEHTKLLLTGGLLAVPATDWQRLDEKRRGPVRYFRRERPRLAELEVWSEGDDLFGDTLRRGGSVVSMVGTVPLLNILDGDLATKANFRLDPLTRGIGGRFDNYVVDLGSLLRIDGYRHLLIAANAHAATFGRWALDFSDGAREADGSLAWYRQFAFEAEPRDVRQMVLESVDFEPVEARFMRIQYFAHENYLFMNANIGELQLRGHGYQPEVTLDSDVIAFSESTNLLAIGWEADTPPGTSVTLQTRTGTGLGEEICYDKTQAGKTLEIGCATVGSLEAQALEAEYDNLRFGAKQAGTRIREFVDPSRFSAWSAPYHDPEGSVITSPSPRPVLVLRATLRTDDPEAHATLKSVSLAFGDPVANRLVGALTPSRVVTLGVDQAFSLTIALDTLQLGLDELLLVPPAGMELARDPAPVLYGGTLAQLEDGRDVSPLARPVEVLLPRPGTSAGDSLHLSFASIAGADAPEAIRLDFTGRLFSPGGLLRAQLRNSQRGGANWQRVDQDRGSLVLLAQPAHKELFRDLALVPALFTPNGDGRNDGTTVSFTLLSVGTGTGVEVDVYDLSGRRVRRLRERRDGSAGTYALPWDGRDEAGNLVPPGVYAVRVKLAGSTAGSGIDRVEALRTVAVAY